MAGEATTAEAAQEATDANTEAKDAEAQKQGTEDEQAAETEPESFDRDYVLKLRKESAGYRSRLKDAEQKAAEFEAAKRAAEDADKSEAERLAEAAEESTLRAAKAEMELHRVTAAHKHGVHPDLVGLINGSTAEEAEAQAELLAKHVGGNGGGKFPPMPHGTQPPPKAKGLAEKIAEAQKQGNWDLAGQLKAQQLREVQQKTT